MPPGLGLGHLKPRAAPPAEAPLAEAPPAASAEQGILVSFQYHLERLSIDSSRGAFEYASFDMSLRYQGSVEGFQKLQEFFNPEKTAERIASFITRGFERTGFGAEGDRGGFVDWIMPFVRQGVDEALSLFSDFAGTVTAPAEETYDHVSSLLDAFAGRQQTSDEDTPQRDEKTISPSGRRERGAASRARSSSGRAAGSPG
jgi:hypothetical protein